MIAVSAPETFHFVYLCPVTVQCYHAPHKIAFNDEISASITGDFATRFFIYHCHPFPIRFEQLLRCLSKVLMLAGCSDLLLG